MTLPLHSRAARLFNSARRSARRLVLATVAFLSVTSFAAAQSALPIFVADFNHDGIPDALVLSTSTPTGTVALGSVPYGTFSPAAAGLTFPAACTRLTGFGGAAPIVIADVNADGFPDIVFRCRTDPSLGADGLAGVMLGNGDGTFAAPVTLPTYISTETVVGDFDGDGKLDVVLVGQLPTSSYGLLFYKGNGDGTFAPPTSLNFGTSSSFNPNFVIESAAAADVNGDGYLDLVTESIFSSGSDPTGAPRILSVFGNNKDGTFGLVTSGAAVPNTTTTLGNYPDVNAFSVLPANVYGSGKPDFLIPDIGTTPGILAVKNTSTPTTYSFATPVRTAFPGLTDARTGNFTGTVFSDIAVASATGITVLANDGAGNFTAGYPTLTALLPTAGQFSGGFAVTDANSDTYSDIYTATSNSTGGIDLNVSLVSGSATAIAAPITLGIGSKDVSAAWPGNVNFSGTTATGTQTIQGVPALVTVTSSSNPATLGDSVTFNVSVAPLTASSIIPTGLLTLQSDGATIASGNLDPTGAFTFTTSQLTQGAHAIQAIYAGDTLFAGALSTDLTQTINALAAPSATTLTVSVSDSTVTSVPAGTVITLTATVEALGTAVSPGQVKFCDASATACTDIHLLGTAELTPNGIATLRFIPGIGTHTYKAVFLGTRNAAQNASATSTLTVTGQYPATTTLAASGVQGSYALTATVNGLGAGSPSGSVMFTDSSTNGTLATVPVTGVVRSFVAGSAISAGSNPNQVVSADVNGDGKPDLVLANQSGAMVTVLIGNGDGTYTSLPSFGTNYEGISGLTVGDFNGDGKLDIATANGSTVGIFLGNGDGTFGAEQDFSNTRNSQGVFAADFNDDGILDLAVTDNNFGITILIGNGDGTFTQPNAAFVTGNSPNFHLAVADFNGDGNLDIAVGNYSDNTVSVLLGNGDGTFQAQATFAAGSGPRATFTGDFNGDGKPDIFVTNGAGASVSVLLGNADGTFQAQQTFAVGANPYGASVGDLNGDGKLDMAVANQNDGTVSVLYGNGDGTFQTQQVLTAGGGADGVIIADGNGDGSPDIETANYSDSTVSVLLNRATASVSLTGVTLPGSGVDNVVATYSGDNLFAGSTSNTLTLPSNPVAIAAVITWSPAAATIPYGTALGAQQLNASAATGAGLAIPGTFVYTPAAGTVLTAGVHTLNVAFTPTSASYLAATGTAKITVTQATPALTWTTPASIAYGIPLGASQLDAAVTGVTGETLPGTFTYTPAAGTVLTPGTHTLSVQFAPTDSLDYVGVSGNVSLLVTGLVPTSVTPSTIPLGSGNTTVTITGAGFVTSSIVQVNGAPVPSTLVNPTTLTAIIPAADFTREGTLQVVIVDPSIGQTSPALTVTVIPASPQVTLSGPSTVVPGTQPTLSFALTNPYPVTLNGDFGLSFAAAVNPPVDDPAVQFATGGRTLTFTVPADSTAVPTVQLQSGTVAGTITVPLVLTANGLNVTPTSIQPVVIVIPAAIPAVSSATMTKSGDQLTVVIHGFSNTREVTQATFHFVGIAGAQIDTPDVTVPVGPAFTAWYSSAASDQYGSTFTYTQTFTVGGGAANIQSVQVTLTNTVGASIMQTAQ